MNFSFLAGQVPQARPCRNPVGPRSRPYINDVITHTTFLTSDLQREYSSGSNDTKGVLFFHMNAILQIKTLPIINFDRLESDFNNQSKVTQFKAKATLLDPHDQRTYRIVFIFRYYESPFCCQCCHTNNRNISLQSSLEIKLF